MKSGSLAATAVHFPTLTHRHLQNQLLLKRLQVKEMAMDHKIANPSRDVHAESFDLNSHDSGKYHAKVSLSLFILVAMLCHVTVM